MKSDVVIRMATKKDAADMLNIYAHYVIETAIAFDYEVPSVKEFSKRISHLMMKYPCIVALEEDRVIGYAYASTFKDRAAYDWAVETTLYINKDYRGKGVGRLLYLTLEDILKNQNIINLYACIAYSPTQDAHLDNASIGFHQYMGYSKVAHFTKCGYKFGKWYDVVWMEKMLGEHPETPKPTTVDFEWLLKL